VAELPATALSLAAIGDETVGLFSVDGQLLRVVENHITPKHRWSQSRKLHDLNTRSRRVLHRTQAADRQPIDFHGWDPSELVQVGDIVVCIEFNEPTQSRAQGSDGNKRAWRMPSLSWSSFRARISRLWSGCSNTQKLAMLAAGILITLHITGVLL